MSGVVLRRADRGESDRYVVLLTREEGKVSAVARGARKAGSRLAGISEPANYLRAQLTASGRTRYLAQAEPLRGFGGLRSDYARLAAALALLEWFDALTIEERPDPDLVDLLVRSLGALEVHPRPDVALAWAELAALAAEGHMPTWTRCAVTDERIVDNPSWFSADAGGFVSAGAVGAFSDRVQVRAETLIGLDKLVALSEPPAGFRPVLEALDILASLLPRVVGRKLPANDVARAQFRLAEPRGVQSEA